MKKVLSLGLATALAVGALSGCGGGKPAETTAAPAAAQTTAAGAATETAAESASEVTEITWWAFPTFGVDTGYEQEVVDAFNAAHSDIRVKVEYIDFTSGPDKLTAALTSGTAPDVLFDAPGRIIEFGEAGYLVSLDDILDDLKGDLTSQSLVETCVGADGTAWMYPISSSPFYMGLNKEALEKADALQYVNLEGDRTWTTENFVKMCEALRDAAPTQVPGIVYCGGQGGDQGTRALVNNLYGSSIVENSLRQTTLNLDTSLKGYKKAIDELFRDTDFIMAVNALNSMNDENEWKIKSELDKTMKEFLTYRSEVRSMSIRTISDISYGYDRQEVELLNPKISSLHQRYFSQGIFEDNGGLKGKWMPTQYLDRKGTREYYVYSYGKQIMDYYTNRQVGTGIVSIEESVLSEICANGQVSRDRDINYLLITDADGRIISHYDKDVIGSLADGYFEEEDRMNPDSPHMVLMDNYRKICNFLIELIWHLDPS